MPERDPSFRWDDAPLFFERYRRLKIFQPLYDRAIVWARHRHAPWLLAGLSFVEAIFFPVMPELMLAPMCLAQPHRAYRFATISLVGSLAGAVVGYALGHYAFAAVQPLLDALGWTAAIDHQVSELRVMVQQSPWQAFWTLVLAGFSPIPLKIFTWASGLVGVPMVAFLAAMFVGRGKRVFVVAAAIRYGGERAETALRKYIEPVGWVALAILVALGLWLYLRGHGA